MKTFERWLMEYMAPGIGQTKTPTQPQPAQPAKPTQSVHNKQQQLPIIPSGSESQFTKQLMTKIGLGDYQIEKELAEIFQTGSYYLSNGGPGRVKLFFNTIRQGLKNSILEKYMNDAERLVVQNRKWDGQVPNLILHDPTWAQQSFSQFGDTDTISSTVGELMGNIGRITQGKTQSSVFSQ